MKKIILLLSAILTSQMLVAQVSIAIGRTTPVGQTVTISGTVTNGSELGVIRYMQDATAGIAIYDFNFSGAVNRGDSVTLTGEMDLFNGLLEIVNVSSYTVIASGKTVTPLVVTPSGMGSANEGQLIQINNVTFSNQGGTFTNGTLSFTNGTESSNIYLSSSHPLIGSVIPQTPVNLTGLSSRFNASAQLILRDANDIVPASNFFVNSAVEQVNLSNSGFDLTWTTNSAGSSNVVYGTDANNLNTHISAGGSTTNHTVAITGLNAGNIYYARAYSVDGADTAWSSMGVYATVSNSTGQIELYFNQATDNSVSTGTNAQYLAGADMENKIISFIDNAQNTIDVAIYNLGRTPIVNALSAAHNRGVRVRVIADNGTQNLALQNGNPPFSWFTGNTGGLMHNKFMVIDANSENDSWVFMGSMNFTSGEIFDNYNSVFFIQDQSLARAYELEFIEMWGTNTATPGIFTKKLGEDKTNNTPHKFLIGGVPIESYFSPSDGTTAEISKALKSADSKIEFATLTFTRNDLRDDIIDRHNAGVTVRGMIENINDTGGEYSVLLNAGVNVKHHSEPFLLHHKYGIVDEDDVNSDPTVITGSHNWTSSAENSNDENTLIIHDATIANLYAQEFNARWMGWQTNTKNVVLGLEGFDLKILGNPAQNTLNVAMTNDRYKAVSLMIYTVDGKLVQTHHLSNIEGATQHSFDITRLNAGNYIAMFQVDGFAVGKQFIVAK